VCNQQKGLAAAMAANHVCSRSKKSFVFVTLACEPSMHIPLIFFTKHLQLLDEVRGFLNSWVGNARHLLLTTQ
jgi:hypothetical protein